jgi:hypothetical protein
MADHPDRPRFTYDVTAVSPDGQHVPLTAGSDISAASEIARARSRDAHWAEMQVRETSTGDLTARYRDGEIVREVVTDCTCGYLDALAGAGT